jgi:hypothetical protein
MGAKWLIYQMLMHITRFLKNGAKQSDIFTFITYIINGERYFSVCVEGLRSPKGTDGIIETDVNMSLKPLKDLYTVKQWPNIKNNTYFLI